MHTAVLLLFSHLRPENELEQMHTQEAPDVDTLHAPLLRHGELAHGLLFCATATGNALFDTTAFLHFVFIALHVILPETKHASKINGGSLKEVTLSMSHGSEFNCGDDIPRLDSYCSLGLCRDSVVVTLVDFEPRSARIFALYVTHNRCVCVQYGQTSWVVWWRWSAYRQN